MERRIILAQLSPLLSDLVRQLLNERTEVWILPSSDSAELIATAARVRADVVVVGTHAYRTETQRCDLSRRLSAITLATLDARGRAGARYRNGVLELEAEDLSPAALRLLLASADR